MKYLTTTIFGIITEFDCKLKLVAFLLLMFMTTINIGKPSALRTNENICSLTKQ